MILLRGHLTFLQSFLQSRGTGGGSQNSIHFGASRNCTTYLKKVLSNLKASNLVLITHRFISMHSICTYGPKGGLVTNKLKEKAPTA